MTESGLAPGAFAPYDLVPVGFEAIYRGQDDVSVAEQAELGSWLTDEAGHVYQQYSLWGFANPTEDTWDDEIYAINAMQTALGPLDRATREIRAHIASMVGCDNGIPVTIDELLNAIGVGALPATPFHNGCWLCRPDARSTQPLQAESMRAIESVLQGYLEGQPREVAFERYPLARGFISRTYNWLGSVDQLSEVQVLLLRRVLLPFEFFAQHNPNRVAVDRTCFRAGGAGKELDAQIAELAGLPRIYPNYMVEYRETVAAIEDEQKRVLYTIAGHIAHGVPELSDCHHSTFRRIERWIHGIGTLQWEMPTHQAHAESRRLGRLYFGYALGLDRWLQDIPMQFLLLDLGHVDLGFDPKNEILRVYAYLGEPTPVRRWLAASLWYKFVLEPPTSLYRWGWRHKELLARAGEAGVSIREWMDGVLASGELRGINAGG